MIFSQHNIPFSDWDLADSIVNVCSKVINKCKALTYSSKQKYILRLAVVGANSHSKANQAGTHGTSICPQYNTTN